MDRSAEQVLVIPTAVFHEAGVFQGFSGRVDYYLPRILEQRHLRYRPRSEVETDPGFKQIVPYVVLRWQDQVFHYTRGKRATESRLHALRSIGVGGHISLTDENLFESPYREGMFREVAEEVRLETPFTEQCLGLINDDSTAVGQVHLGIVHIFDLQEPKVTRREQALTQTGFSSIQELHAQRDDFETWSKFALAALLAGPAWAS
jgi:predicted NUDIX family phosphoesterase